jgi:hypothetical protein
MTKDLLSKFAEQKSRSSINLLAILIRKKKKKVLFSLFLKIGKVDKKVIV